MKWLARRRRRVEGIPDKRNSALLRVIQVCCLFPVRGRLGSQHWIALSIKFKLGLLLKL